MFFGSRIAKASGASSIKFSGARGRRAGQLAVSNAAYRGIEQLEERWMLAANAFSANFVGYNGTTAISMNPTDVAGVVPFSNFNNLTTGSGTAQPLMDSTGSTAAGTTTTWSSPGFWASQYNTVVPATGDQKLNDGFVYSAGTGTPVNVSVNNIPFATYDVYVYILNDGGGRPTTTTANGTSYYLTTATGPGDANHVSGVANTYQYIRATSTNSAAPTANADYVLFSGQSGSSFSFTSASPNNGSVNGFQIVQVVAPDAPVLSTPAVTHNTVNLIWSAPTATASTTYSVFRSDAAHPTPVQLVTGVTGLTYGDATAVDGTTYTYFVKANNAAGSSPASNSQLATPVDGIHAVGVNFSGGGNGQSSTPLAPTDIGGIFPVAHFNNIGGGNGTNLALTDSSGAATGATLTFTGGGAYASHSGPIVPGNPDQALNEGFVFGDSSVTINNIPFSHYAVYVYELNDAAGRPEITTANGVSYYGTSADPYDGAHINNNSNTPYTYTQTASTDPNNPTAGGDYVKYDGLTASSFTFTTTTGIVGSNGYLNGFQIVDEPVAAPAAPVLNDPTIGNNVVSLTWTAKDAYTYTIFRSDPAHPTPVAIASNIGGISYIDSTAVNGTTYTYFLTGKNTFGTSPNSNTKTATPQPLAPVAPALTGATIAASTVKLNWNTVPFASTYSVRRGTSLAGPFTDLATGLLTPGYVDSTATGNGTYYYVVVAVNGGGTSPNSNVVFTANNINSISVNFTGGGNGASVSMDPTDVAGVYLTGNFNNVAGGTANSVPLHDSNGLLFGSAPTMNVTAGGTYNSTGTVPATADQKLNNGFIYGDSTVTISNIPFGHYDVYIYELNDASGRVETTTANGVSYYGSAANPTDAGHVSGAANTYIYTQSTSTDAGNPTLNGDWVLFSNQSGATFTFKTTAPGNGYLNGFQIVNHPIAAPVAPVLLSPAVVNDGYVRVAWTDPDGLTYNVFRSDAAHPTPVAVGTGVSSTSFIDTTVTNGTAYTYYVVAINPYGTSGNSNTVVATPIPAAPTLPATNVFVARTNTTTTVLTWTGPEFGKTYSVQRSTSLNGTYTTLASGLTALTYTDTTATTAGGVDYFYKIISANGGGAGPASLPAFVGHGSGFTGAYYTANALNTTIRTGDDPNSILSFVRTDPTINFVGDATTPPPNVPPGWNSVQSPNPGQYFSVRWTGSFEAPVSGYYTMFPSSDDGIRVLYNGAVLAPSSLTSDRGVTEDTVPVVDTASTPVFFNAGDQIPIQVDYNQGGGGWGAALRFAVSSTAANQTGHVYDALSKQLVPSYDTLPPVPSFSTQDALGTVDKDSAYYTFTGTGLRLNWADIGADSYNIYRSTSFGGPYTKVNTSPILPNTAFAGGQDSYFDTDPNLVSGTSYVYVVTGVNVAGETPINVDTGDTTGLRAFVTPAFIPGTTGNDFIYLSQDPNVAGQVDWWIKNTAFTSSPVGTTPPTGTASNFSFGGPIAVLGRGGTDVITLDLTHGDFRSDTSLPVEIANSSPSTLQLVGSGFGDVLQLDPQHLNTAGTPGSFFQTNGVTTLIDVGGGVDTFKVSGATGGTAAVNVYSGNYKLDGNTASGPATVALHVFGPRGAVTLAATQHLASLTMTGGVTNVTGVVDVDSLALDATAKVNLNGTLKVHYTGATVLPTILPLIISGRNSGTWDGAGIQSTGAHASGGGTAVGYSDVAGVVTLKYTRNGDSDLNGSTSFADLVAVAQNYGQSGSQTWAKGDFNYDGKTDFADLVAVAQNYGSSLPAAPVEAAPVPAPVPAPVAVESTPVVPVTTTPPVVTITAPITTTPTGAKVGTTTLNNPVTVTKPVSVSKPVGTAKPVSVSAPVVVTPAAKPAKVVKPASATPFAPTTQFRSQNSTSSVLGDVLEKKPVTNVF